MDVAIMGSWDIVVATTSIPNTWLTDIHKYAYAAFRVQQPG
jgi:hypothetical protein